MNMALKDDYQVLNLNKDQIYVFSEGIPGFEKVTQYCLLYKEEEAPFLHLSAVGSFDLEFIVVNPWSVLPAYKPEVANEDLESIGSPDKQDLIVLAMVIVAEPLSESTINLAAPVLINAKTGKGKQIIIRNIKEYSSKHPLLSEQNQAVK